MSTDAQTQPELFNKFDITLHPVDSTHKGHSSSDTLLNSVVTDVSDNILGDISRKLSKYVKSKREKVKRRAALSANKQMSRSKAQNTDHKYYKLRKNKRLKKRYKQDNDYRQKKKQYINSLYSKDGSFKDKQKQYIKSRYKKDSGFQDKQKQYMNSRYRKDSGFKDKRKQYIKTHYRNENLEKNKSLT